MTVAAEIASAAESGARVVLCAGGDLPFPLLRAAGLTPVLLRPDPTAVTPFADARGLGASMGWRARALLQLIADHGRAAIGLVVSHEDAVLPQLFATLRELPELGRSDADTFFCDLLHRDLPEVRAYNERQLAALEGWAAALGHPVDPAISTEQPAADPVLPHLVVGSDAVLPQPGPATLLDRAVQWTGGSFAGLDRFEQALDEALASGRVDTVTHLTRYEDEAAPWTAGPAERRCVAAGVPFRALPERRAGDPAVAAQLRGEEPPPAVRPAAAARPPSATPPPRSRKLLASTDSFGAYQRAWFARTRERAAAGEPFAVVNANAPQELLQALDISFVVNQWWASIVAAKQQSGRYAALLRANGLPDRTEAYSSQGLAAAFDTDPEAQPWGGLPRPTMLHAVLDTDATRGLFDSWARVTGAELFYYDRTIERRWQVPTAWWDDLHDRWEATLESDRLDLFEQQLLDAAERLHRTTGRRLDPDRFATVLALVNEQEGYYRRTRDLIAAAPRAPVSVVDTMPATMVPQWHRGTEWGRDAARAFHDEVAALVASGSAACADERLRLMWVGRGLWNRTSFYQQWEQSHGAVFVWSMYLALAADGYIRRYDRPDEAMRSLAARFLTMGDELRMPTWSGAWHVKEARSHRVDAAVALDDADPLVLAALERSGVPVLRLPLSNYDTAGWEAQEARVTAFLDGLR
ncbi:2-hydroxyglutaryl-CoA dehydratase, D-component [Sphingomonas guangdongensis]|uniref:2-hydroxyglutaryl-CoA dehydratase, D-component n=1 Tax=Sphingomonas guangdongensis TaxID=1141890 RepID=A0A285R3B2_9SPHN|nr:2-hydroxyacyl-CoA dehydratase family protein [Sphingomonas guangdongensis]SOB88248.1 2-hydroxyglutaryl-CoA dehydratase, D-component [Sphingomonas guangdongensis]